jgi:hypothetical protein
MSVYDYTSWGVIAGLALMVVGGLMLWAYGARYDRLVAMSLTVSGPEAEAIRLYHSTLARRFFSYGCAIIVLGAVLLVGCGLIHC